MKKIDDFGRAHCSQRMYFSFSYPQKTPQWRLHIGAPCSPNPLSCPAERSRPAPIPPLSFEGCMPSPCEAAPAPLSLPAACLAMFAYCCTLGCQLHAQTLIMLGDVAHLHESTHGMHPLIILGPKRRTIPGQVAPRYMNKLVMQAVSALDIIYWRSTSRWSRTHRLSSRPITLDN